MDAVLEKFAIVGVRRQITADYLSSLGYIEGLHHMVIGSPSTYMFGRDLNIRDTNIIDDKNKIIADKNKIIDDKNKIMSQKSVRLAIKASKIVGKLRGRK